MSDKARDGAARLALAAILLAFLALAWLYATRVPKWNAPDEPAHYNYIRHIAETGSLPVLQPGDYDVRQVEARMSAQFPDSMPVNWMRYESHQPPLYYLVATPVYLAASGSSVDERVVILRMATSLMGALAIVLIYLAAREALPSERLLALGAAGVAAFVPMFVHLSAAVENDALSTAVTTGGLLMLMRLLRGADGWRFHSAVGGVIGLALLTKVAAYILVPLAVAAYVVAGHRARYSAGGWRAVSRWAIASLGTATGVAALLSGWWFIRNMIIYGPADPFGLRRHDLVVAGQPLTGGVSAEALKHFFLTLFRSFWAQFGWMGIVAEDRLYTLLALLSGAAILGLALLAIRGRRTVDAAGASRDAVWLLVGAFSLVVAATVFYNLTYLQPQGRYLFPAMLPISLGLTAGVGALSPRVLRPLVLAGLVVGLAALALACLYRYVIPYFAT